MTMISKIDNQALDAEAERILRLNDKGTYTVPTHGLYPYQWNWDSAITALGWAEIDLDRAWTEIETLMASQWDSGMVPHIIFHVPDDSYFPGPDVWQGRGPVPSSGITQPAVAASMVRRILAQDPGQADRMRALYPKFRAWHAWYMAWRRDTRGAIVTTHPWESGRDNAPEWDRQFAAINPVGVGEYQRRDTGHVDPSMRPTKFEYDRYIYLVQEGAKCDWNDAAVADLPFRVSDPTMTFLFLRAHRDLFEMGGELGLETEGMAQDLTQLEAGARSLWNDDIGSYDGRDADSGEFRQCLSNASYLCWFAGVGTARQRAHLNAVLDRLPFGIPSHDPGSPNFDAKRYWRGPTWAFINMLVGMGLADAGETALAQRVQRVTRDLIAANGFSEYFDPTDGSPAGGTSFSWTAAVWLAWARHAVDDAV
ncbi:hypothetical protein V8J82_03600 [Gymnodinialimonas sp. 2305UL16-5]|uniref:MGH1-like glycoside hydrolase domain-containing protein n=1 Tax=Gymnodinialimonas mytili TaxID=3126503 RepID=UPI0030ABFB9E